MRYIDTHAHVFPDDIAPKVVTQLENYYKMKWHGDGTVDDLAANSADAGVSRTVIFSTATKPAQVKVINDYISSLCRNSSQFIGLGTIHPDYPDIEKELARFPSLGLKGLKLHPDFQQFNIDDPKMLEIYRIIDSSMPILFHTGDEHYDHSSPRRLANAVDAVPGLVVIAAHLGGYCRWKEAEKYLAGRSNVYFDTSSCFHKITFEYGRELIRMHGADRVLFASDYPAASQKEAISQVMQMNLDPEENELIFHRNAEKLFNLTIK